MSLWLAWIPRCTTYEEKALNRLHTLCNDGPRAISTYNKVLERWGTAITASPRKALYGANEFTRQEGGDAVSLSQEEIACGNSRFSVVHAPTAPAGQ